MINQMISSTAGGAVVGAASSSIFTGVGLVIGGPSALQSALALVQSLNCSRDNAWE